MPDSTATAQTTAANGPSGSPMPFRRPVSPTLGPRVAPGPSSASPAAPPSSYEPDPPLALGTRYVGDIEIPESLRFDHGFLAFPRTVQIELLTRIREGNLSVNPAPVVTRTVRKNMRLRFGQYERLEEIIKQAKPFEDDRRRSLTANSLARELLDLCFAYVLPHVDLANVSTEDALRQEIAAGFRRACNSSGPLD